MIVAIVSIILFLVCLFYKKNKAVFILMFIWMWLLMGFTTGIADEKGIYMSRYASPESWKGSSELLYNVILIFFNRMHFTFYEFKATITFIQLILIFSTVWKLSKYPNLVVALYMIYPFPLNIAQMRSALAVSIFIFSYRYLIEDNSEFKNKKNKCISDDIKYIIGIFIATFIHSSSLIWLVLLFAKKLSFKKNIIIMVGFNIIILAISPNKVIRLLDYFGAGNRMSAYFSTEYQLSSWRHYGGTLVQVTFTAIMLLLLCWFIYRKKEYFDPTNNVEFLIKANTIILVIYGIIIKYTGEIYRLQEGMTLLNFMLITNSFVKEKLKKTKIRLNTFNALVILLVFVGSIAYISIGQYLIPTIIEPILNNNMILNSILK